MRRAVGMRGVVVRVLALVAPVELLSGCVVAAGSSGDRSNLSVLFLLVPFALMGGACWSPATGRPTQQPQPIGRRRRHRQRADAPRRVVGPRRRRHSPRTPGRVEGGRTRRLRGGPTGTGSLRQLSTTRRSPSIWCVYSASWTRQPGRCLGPGRSWKAGRCPNLPRRFGDRARTASRPSAWTPASIPSMSTRRRRFDPAG